MASNSPAGGDDEPNSKIVLVTSKRDKNLATLAIQHVEPKLTWHSLQEFAFFSCDHPNSIHFRNQIYSTIIIPSQGCAIRSDHMDFIFPDQDHTVYSTPLNIERDLIHLARVVLTKLFLEFDIYDPNLAVTGI